MDITGFKITPNVAALGETVKVSFDVKLGQEEILYGPIQIVSELCGIYTLVEDMDWTLTESATLSYFITLDGVRNQELIDLLNTNRAVIDPEWGVYLDKLYAFSNPITYINSRHLPTIERFYLERATDGVPDDSGENLLSTLKLALDKTADSSMLTVRLHYAQDGEAGEDSPYIDLSGRLPELISGVENSDTLIAQSFVNSSDWNFLLIFGDEYENARMSVDIYEAFANLHLSGARNGGVCVGGFSSATDNNPKFECHYPAYFYGGIALGGMKDFSAEEVDTGVKWTNGKPIYRRTITGRVMQTGAFVTIGTIDTLEQVVNIAGGILTSSNMFVPVNTYFNSTYWFSCFVGATGVGSIDCVSTAGYLGTAVITIEYTKSTDVETFVELLDVGDNAIVDVDNNPVAVVSEGSPVYRSKFTGSTIDAGIERALALEGLPGVNAVDNGKVLTVVDGAWVAADLPKYGGEYSVTPAVEEQTLLTSQKYLDANLRIEKIPYSEVSNTANGTTATIG